MKVHQLAAELGVTNEALGDFLEGLGEKRWHLAGVSDEAAYLARDHFSEGQWGIGEDSTTPESFAADPEGLHIEQLPPAEPPIDPDLPPAVLDHEPAEDAINLVSDGGGFRGRLLLEPVTAARLQAALKGRQCADACLYPERCELVAVTWPDYQKIIIRTED